MNIESVELENFLSMLLEVKKIANAAFSPLRVALVSGSDLISIPPNPNKSELLLDDDKILASHLINPFEEFLDFVSVRLGVNNLVLCRDDPNQLNSFETAVSRCLNIDVNFINNWKTFISTDFKQVDFLPLIEQIEKEAVDIKFNRKEIRTHDNGRLNVYSTGNPAATPIVLVIPCGMPFELSRSWFDLISEKYFDDYYIVTWESRGMFFIDDSFEDIGYDIDSQVNDLNTVMDYYGLPTAKVMGLCIGVSIALKMAYDYPQRVEALILGNGFYSLPDCPKTQTELQLVKTISTVKSGRGIASRMQEMFSEPGYLGETDDKAHLTLYPYSTSELLYRYGKLSESLLSANKNNWLSEIDQPSLVVVGLSDTVVHPQGSVLIAEALKNSSIQKMDGEDHLSIFGAVYCFRNSVLEFFNSFDENKKLSM